MAYRAELQVGEAAYRVHRSLMTACRNTGDVARATAVQRQMEDLGLKAFEAVATVQMEGEEVTYIDGKMGTPTWLSDELHYIWHRVLAETDYEPRLEALPLAARQRLRAEHKFVSIRHHAEKKAIAHLLKRSSASTQLEVHLSLRMCADCHAFLQGVAQLTNRCVTVHEPTTMYRLEPKHATSASCTR